MNQIKEIAGIASFSIGLTAAVPYVISIIRGHRPPYTTYVSWLLIGVTALVFHYQTIDPLDEKWSTFVILAFAMIPAIYITLLVALGSKWVLDSRDRLVLMAVLFCWIGWVAVSLFLDNQRALPVVLLILTEGFATWPILQNALRGEESALPNQISWNMTALSAWLSLASIANYNSAELLYPLYITAAMSTLAWASIFCRKF